MQGVRQKIVIAQFFLCPLSTESEPRHAGDFYGFLKKFWEYFEFNNH